MTAPRQPEDRPDVGGSAAPGSQPSSALRVRTAAERAGAPAFAGAKTAPASPGYAPGGAPPVPRPTRSFPDVQAAGRRTTVSIEDDGRVLAVGWPLAPLAPNTPPVFVTSARALAYRPTAQLRLDASGVTEARVARVEWATDVALVVLPPAVTALAKRLGTNALKLAAPGTTFAALNAVASTFVAVGPLESAAGHPFADQSAKTTGEIVPGTPIVEPGGTVVGMAVAHEHHRVWVVGAARLRELLDALGPDGLGALATDSGAPKHVCPACNTEARLPDATAMLACRHCGAAFPLAAIPRDAPPELALLRRWVVSAGIARGLLQTRGQGGKTVVVVPHRGQSVELDVSADGGWLRARIPVIPLGGSGEAVLRGLLDLNDRAPGEPGVVVHEGTIYVSTCEPIAAASTLLRQMVDQTVDRWDAVVTLLS